MIREECAIIARETYSGDMEKGISEEDPREELELWIEDILKDDSDSDSLAAERMEVIISPILRSIRCRKRIVRLPPQKCICECQCGAPEASKEGISSG